MFDKAHERYKWIKGQVELDEEYLYLMGRLRNEKCIGDKIKATIRLEGGLAGLFFGIGLLLAGSAHQIVHTDLIEIGQGFPYFRGYIPPAVFIIGVASLCAIEQLCQILLLQITILPQISYPPVHNTAPICFAFLSVYTKQNVILPYITKRYIIFLRG